MAFFYRTITQERLPKKNFWLVGQTQGLRPRKEWEVWEVREVWDRERGRMAPLDLKGLRARRTPFRPGGAGISYLAYFP